MGANVAGPRPQKYRQRYSRTRSGAGSTAPGSTAQRLWDCRCAEIQRGNGGDPAVETLVARTGHRPRYRQRYPEGSYKRFGPAHTDLARESSSARKCSSDNLKRP